MKDGLNNIGFDEHMSTLHDVIVKVNSWLTTVALLTWALLYKRIKAPSWMCREPVLWMMSCKFRTVELTHPVFFYSQFYHRVCFINSRFCSEELCIHMQYTNICWKSGVFKRGALISFEFWGSWYCVPCAIFFTVVSTIHEMNKMAQKMKGLP